MFRLCALFFVFSILLMGCDTSDLILDDVLLTDSDKGTFYINPDNLPSAYSRYPAGDFIVDIPEDILLKIGSYSSSLFHDDRIYYCYAEYDILYNIDARNGGGIVICDKNGKYISHKEIEFPRGKRRLPNRFVPVTVHGLYDNHLIIRVLKYTDLYWPYDRFAVTFLVVILNLDTFEYTGVEGSSTFGMFAPEVGRETWAEFVSGNILYMRRSPTLVSQTHWDYNLQDTLYAYDLDLGEYRPEQNITLKHGYKFDWQIAGEPPRKSDAFIIDIDETRNNLSAQLARASFDSVKYDGMGGLWVNVTYDWIVNQDIKNCDIHPSYSDNFLAKFDMQGNFTGEIVDIDATCEDYQTYNRNIAIFPQGSDSEFLYFPARDPNKGLDWAWKPYKYICYKKN